MLDGLTLDLATTATSLGFDFIQNPTILALPDDPITNTAAGRSVPTPTPRTPALEPSLANEQEDEDDDWEHISGAHTREEGDEGDIILLGELELEHAVTGAGEGAKEGKGKAEVKSYAAAVGAAMARATQ